MIGGFAPIGTSGNTTRRPGARRSSSDGAG